MRTYQQFMLGKTPKIDSIVYTEPKAKLFCVSIIIEKNTTIDIYFKLMGDMVDFIQKIARQIEPAEEKDARDNRKDRKQDRPRKR